MHGPGNPGRPEKEDTVVVERPLRADARRNRTRVLAAAEAVFAAKGTDASTEEVARAAGVGIGTVFRHFPTKEALLQAVFVDRLRRLTDQAVQLSTADDPGAAFFGFFTEMVAHSATKNAYADALTAAGIDIRDALGTGRDELLAAMGTLLRKAQDAGAVRADIGVPELIALLIGAARSAEAATEVSVVTPAASGRALEILFDGLRGTAAAPHPATTTPLVPG
jgi:AcrR family transcriptional regulator